MRTSQPPPPYYYQPRRRMHHVRRFLRHTAELLLIIVIVLGAAAALVFELEQIIRVYPGITQILRFLSALSFFAGALFVAALSYHAFRQR